jgi:hypothetical protein
MYLQEMYCQCDLYLMYCCCQKKQKMRACWWLWPWHHHPMCCHLLQVLRPVVQIVLLLQHWYELAWQGLQQQAVRSRQAAQRKEEVEVGGPGPFGSPPACAAGTPCPPVGGWVQMHGRYSNQLVYHLLTEFMPQQVVGSA